MVRARVASGVVSAMRRCMASRPGLMAPVAGDPAVPPDGDMHVILDGVGSPARLELGTMPAYRDSFSDAQAAEPVSYLNRQFACGKSAWQDVAASAAGPPRDAKPGLTRRPPERLKKTAFKQSF